MPLASAKLVSLPLLNLCSLIYAVPSINLRNIPRVKFFAMPRIKPWVAR